MTEKLLKRDLKQIDLNMEDNRIIYLYKIIMIIEERMNRLERYILDIGEHLLENYKGQNIPYDEAMLYFDAVEYIHCYLLNVLGDSQSSSISYFKYRNFCKQKNYQCTDLDQDTESYLVELNKERNFCNHIPESILVEDIKNIKSDDRIQKNKKYYLKNIGVPIHNDVDYEYFFRKNEAIKRFYFGIKHIRDCIIKDYKVNLGEEIQIIPMEAGTSKEIDHEYVQRVAKNIQKINGNIPEEWINYD